MTALERWVERHFPGGLSTSRAPNVLARLRGAPARLEELLAGAAPEVLTRHEGQTWSMLENAGHLSDLEPLWAARVEDLLCGAERLTPWETTNELTHAAGHDATDPRELAARFRGLRLELLARLEELTPTDFERSALHQRLGVPMRLIDLCAFVAEHDDHHLARVHELSRGG